MSLVATFACGDGTGPDQGPRMNGRIVFASREGDPRGERQQIYAMDPDGGNKVRLTHELIDGYSILPARSGGSRVSFIEVKGGVFSGVFTMRGDGSELTGPFAFGFSFLGPVSPDETRILGVIVANGEQSIGIGDLLTGEVATLAVGDLLVLDLFWSPDGDWIGFTGRDDQTILSDLYLIRTDGRDLHRITEDEAGELAPSWSPDGRHIVFTRETLGQLPTLHTINPDGSDLRRLAPLDCHGSPPAWSPEGSELLCTNIRGETEAIIEFATGESRATGFPLGGCSRWSPDGTKLLCFNSNGVHTMKTDGSELSLIIPFDGGSSGAVWLRAEDD